MTVSKFVGMQSGWIAMMLMAFGHVEATNIQLTWDPPPEQVAGYRLYYGQNSGNYDLVVDVGRQTSYTLSGIAGDQGCYFTVTAYDEMGDESVFADEVSAFLATSNSELQESVAPEATPNSELREPMVPETTLPPKGLGRGNGHEAAARASSMSHGPERQSWVSSSLPHLMAEQIESGEIPVDHEWSRVEFRETFVDPIVVARGKGRQQASPAALWIRDVTAKGFEVRLQSWDDAVVLRPSATVSYLVIERGAYGLPNGTVLEAGSVELEQLDAAIGVAFSQQFAAIPVVMTSIADAPELEIANNAPVRIAQHGFRLLIETASQEHQAINPLRVDYIAWEPSWGVIDGIAFDINRLDHSADETSQTVLFQQTFEETPVFLADVQDLEPGYAPLTVCWDYPSTDSVEVAIESNNTALPEMSPRDLVVGYIAVRKTVFN